MISIKPFIRRETLKRNKQVSVRFRIYEYGITLSYTSDIKITPALWDFNTGLYGFTKQYIDPQFKVVT